MSSRNIEENVVKMRFDNQEFDQNIEQSNDTVNKFKNTLTTLPQQIYIGLSNTLSSINIRDIIGIGAALGGIALVKNGVQSLGYDIQAICSNTLFAINNVFNTAISQINAGGRARAMNIANAKFQIEGLKLDVDTFMEAADYAVSGTAYGLDAAAKVASQLGASGVTQLEELKTALRSVSGVAAMTNSSYEEIGNIYTTMASNGRLMTENIRSFSARGLNITANLAKALNKTEAEISDMVTKGKIDFKTFYTAMDEAFGEHAKDANKTFDGALSNIRAALSRVGEGLWTPIIQNSVDVFNALRLTINQFKAELTDNHVYEVFADSIKSIYQNAKNMIDLVKYSLERTNFMEELSFFFKDIMVIAKELVSAFSFDYSFVVDGIVSNIAILVNKFKQLIWAIKESLDEAIGIRKLGGDFNSLILWVSTLLQSLDQINDLDLKDVFTSWFKGIKSVYETVTDILGIKRENISKIFDNIVKTVFELFKQLKLSDDRIDKITRTFRGLASALDIIKMLVTSIFNFVKPLFDYIPSIVDGLLTATAVVGDAIYDIREAIKENEVFDRIFQKIIEAAVFFKDLIQTIGVNFFEAFFGDDVKNEKFIDRLKDFVRRIGEALSTAFENLNLGGIDLSPIAEFIKNLANFGLSDGEQSDADSNLNWIAKVINKIKDFFTLIGDFFNDNIFSLFSNEDGKFDKLNDFIKSIGDGVSGFIDTLGGFVSEMNISDVTIITVGYLTYKILEMVKDVIMGFYDFVLQLAAILTGQSANVGSNLISSIEKFLDKISPSAGIFSKIHTLLTDIQNINLNEILHGYQNKSTFEGVMANLGAMLKAFGLAMIEIAAALFIIALIPQDRLKQGVDILVQMGTMIAMIIGAITLIFNITTFKLINQTIKGFSLNFFSTNTSESPFAAIPRMIQALGLVFIEVAGALFIITTLCDPTKVKQGVKILKSMLMLIAVIAGLLLGEIAYLKIDHDSIDEFGDVLAALTALIIAIAAAIAIIVISFKSGEEGKVWLAFGVIAALITIMAGIFALVAGLAEGKDTVPLSAGLGLFLAINAFIAAIITVAGAILLLSQIPADKLSAATGVLAILIGVIGLFSILAVVAGGLIGQMGPEALLGMGIAVAAILSLASTILSAAPIFAAMAGIVASFALVIKSFKELIEVLAGLDGSIAEKIIKNVTFILFGLADSIPMSIAKITVNMMEVLRRLFPEILKFVITDVLPFISGLFDLIIPESIKKLIEGSIMFSNATLALLPTFLNLMDDLFLGSGSILEYIFKMLNVIWDDTVDWLNDRIPIVVPDIFAIILTFLRAVNAALSENWEDLDKELQTLIDQTIALAKDLLTGNKTWADIDEMIGEVFDHVKEAVNNNRDSIREAFESIGEVMGSAIFTGLVNALPDGKIKDWILEQSGYDDSYAGMTTTHDWGSSISGINSTNGRGFSDFSSMSDNFNLDTVNQIGNNFGVNGYGFNASDISRTITNNVNVHNQTTVDLKGSIRNLFKANVSEEKEQKKSGRLSWQG